MSAARPALPALSLGLLALLTACGGHPPATAPEKQASPTVIAEPAPAPVPEASSADTVLAAVVSPGPSPSKPASPTLSGPSAGAGGLAPLTTEQRALLLAGEEDTLIDTPIHYVKSNEVRHDVWFPYTRGVGGAYLGVGSDQNYTVAAAARSELMILTDIDRTVVDLHRIYEVLIEASETPEILHDRFARAQEAANAALLETAFAELPELERRRLVRRYRNARETVHVHLGHVIKRKRGDTPTSWLSDRAMYDHIRALFQADRVRMMGGDLTGPSSLQTAAAAATALGLPFRVIYLSNAEEYFDYTTQFRANFAAFPIDDKSVLLRTIYNKAWEHADQLWAYQVQPLADFKRRLDDRKNRSRNPMLRYAEVEGTLDRATGTKGLSLIALGVVVPQHVWALTVRRGVASDNLPRP